MGRMIYTRVVFDMGTGAVLEQEGYWWNGPVAECKGGGGGSSTTNTVDYAYNARMATLSEEQQGWARDYYNMWQQYQKPYEIAQTQANMELLPLETNLYKNQLTAATQLLPQQTEAAQLAGARTQARVGAEQENYDRLTKAAGFNATGGILQGLGFMNG